MEVEAYRDKGACDKVNISRQEHHHVENLGLEADSSCWSGFDDLLYEDEDGSQMGEITD